MKQSDTDPAKAVPTVPDEQPQSSATSEASLASVDGEATEEHPVRRPAIRRAVVGVVFAAICIGIVLNAGYGSLSSFGWDAIASICPLGALESMVAGKLLVPRVLVVLAVAVVLILVLGKVFCAWVCPVPSISHVLDAFRHKRPVVRRRVHPSASGEQTSIRVERPAADEKKPDAHKGACSSGCAACTACTLREPLDARHLVLGGSLLSAAVFGFPVFCLVCPIGLTFGTVVAVAQLFGLQAFSWGVVLFPLVLVLELTVLRKWCHRFCPLGALMGLIARGNRFFRPKVDAHKCLRSHGIDCHVCTDVCPEALDPHSKAGMHECSKCRDCAANCPAQAITFPTLRK